MFLHLLPDTVDGLGAALELVFQPFGFEALVDGTDEILDIFVACFFGLLQAVSDLREDFSVQVFEGGVL